MNKDGLFEMGDYCLFCCDISCNVPTKYQPCYVVEHQNHHDDFVSVKFLEDDRVVSVNKKNLILVKNNPSYEVELMYNSSAKKGGSINLTTDGGTHLRASFYFDNENDKKLAEDDAKTFSNLKKLRKYRFTIGDLDGRGHNITEEIHVYTSASKIEMIDMIKSIPVFFEGYQFFEISNQYIENVKYIMSDENENFIPIEFMRLLVKKIDDFPLNFGTFDESRNGYVILFLDIPLLLEKIFNYIAKIKNYPSISIERRNEIIDLPYNCFYGVF